MVATVGFATPPVGATPTQPGCVVVEQEVSTWPTGFMLTLSLTNICDVPVPGWTVALSFAPGHTVTQGWSADWSWSGNQVTGTGLPWNERIDPGSTITIGLIGQSTDDYFGLTDCSVNGAPCDGKLPPEGDPPQVSLTSPGAGQLFISPCPVLLRANASIVDGTIDRVEFYLDDRLVGVDGTAPYQVELPAHELDHTPHTVFARAVTTEDPPRTNDSEPVAFQVAVPPPALMVVPCVQQMEIEEGGSDLLDLRLSINDTAQMELTVAGDPGITVAPASFTIQGRSGERVVVSAEPGTAGSTARITAAAPGFITATIAVTVVARET